MLRLGLLLDDVSASVSRYSRKSPTTLEFDQVLPSVHLRMGLFTSSQTYIDPLVIFFLSPSLSLSGTMGINPILTASKRIRLSLAFGQLP